MVRSLAVVREARGCTACASSLPLGARPLLAGSRSSRILIVGQAPGRAAHESGTPWNDRSGDRLLAWLGLSRDELLDEARVALLPMGFCYPGAGKSGDLAPRAECAPLWHAKILRGLASVELTIYVGHHAFAEYLGERFESLTDAVRGHAALLPERIALPHPSPRNAIWLRKHPWFEEEVVPALRARVASVLRG